MKKCVLYLAVVLLFCCCQRNSKSVCGVPVQGTPWELAAAIADNGDGSIMPECVFIIFDDRAFIEGWGDFNTDTEHQAFIDCTLRDGRVVDATIKTTLAGEGE